MVDVVVLKCENYDDKVYSVVKDALDKIGADKILKKGMKVLIKPNLLQPAKPEKCISTHPKVIEAIILYLKKHDVEIFLGESSAAFGKGTTETAFRLSGLEEVAKKHKIKIINFENEKYIVKKIEDGITTKNLAIPKILDNIDIVINACKLKTHMLMGFTGAIKNMYGIISQSKKINGHAEYSNKKDFSNFIIDIFLAIKPKINIMDAILGMEGNGPGGGKPKKTGLIIASTDGFAMDIVASEIIGFKENSLEYLLQAKKRKLVPEKISISGEKNVKIPYKKPLTYGFSFVNKISAIGISFLKSNYDVDKKKCIKCGRCSKICPKKVIDFKKGEFPVFNIKGCILCACCHEVCPSKAVLYKKRILRKIADKIRIK